VRRTAWKRVVSINRFTSDTAADEVEMLKMRIPFARVEIALSALPPPCFSLM